MEISDALFHACDEPTTGLDAIGRGIRQVPTSTVRKFRRRLIRFLGELEPGTTAFDILEALEEDPA